MSSIYFLIGTIAVVAACIMCLIYTMTEVRRSAVNKGDDLNRQILSEMTEANRLRHVQITALCDLANAMRGE